MYANLAPEAVDIKIGNSDNGPAMGPIIDINIPVPIRIFSAGKTVVDAGFTLTYNPLVINVVGCTQPSQAQGFSQWSCTFDETPGTLKVTMVAAGDGVSSSTLGIHSADVFLSRWNGTTQREAEGSLELVDITARLDHLNAITGVICGSSPRGMCPDTTAGASTEVYAPHKPVIPAPTGRRGVTRLLQDMTTSVNGDTDGDGMFGIDDIKFAMDYYNNADPVGCLTFGGKNVVKCKICKTESLLTVPFQVVGTDQVSQTPSNWPCHQFQALAENSEGGQRHETLSSCSMP